MSSLQEKMNWKPMNFRKEKLNRRRISRKNKQQLNKIRVHGDCLSMKLVFLTKEVEQHKREVEYCKIVCRGKSNQRLDVYVSIRLINSEILQFLF